MKLFHLLPLRLPLPLLVKFQPSWCAWLMLCLQVNLCLYCVEVVEVSPSRLDLDWFDVSCSGEDGVKFSFFLTSSIVVLLLFLLLLFSIILQFLFCWFGVCSIFSWLIFFVTCILDVFHFFTRTCWLDVYFCRDHFKRIHYFLHFCFSNFLKTFTTFTSGINFFFCRFSLASFTIYMVSDRFRFCWHISFLIFLIYLLLSHFICCIWLAWMCLWIFFEPFRRNFWCFKGGTILTISFGVII